MPQVSLARNWLKLGIIAGAGLTLMGLGLGGAISVQAEPLPRLARNGQAVQLMVDGKPYIALAGEVHNSTASSASYMAPVWDKLASAHLNTVVTPAYWELIEPAEGQYDFALIDDQIRQARTHNMRIVLLWFGTLKNAKSTYAPAWVLSDRKRFPRAVTRPGKNPFDNGEPVLSVFSETTVNADTRAFATLMAHIAQTDPQHTVIAIQVENETGLLGDSRDRSATAETAWKAPVPAALTAKLKGVDPASPLSAIWRQNGSHQKGTWGQVFGSDPQAEEIFMAWAVSQFVNRVASAGKANLPLPMYANAWLGPQKAGDQPGTYPSGGPEPHVFEVWEAGAPALDWISPDIYVDDFDKWAGAFAGANKGLFVPETQFRVGNLFTALGQFNGFGFSPFGIEDGVPGNQMSDAYDVLSGALPLIAKAQSEGKLAGFALKPDEARTYTMGRYKMTVRGQRDALNKRLRDMGVPVQAPAPEPKIQTAGWGMPEMSDLRPAGLLIELGQDEFLLAGHDIDLSVSTPSGERVEVLRVEEGGFEDGQWVPRRVINGDERLSILPAEAFGMVRLKVLP